MYYNSNDQYLNFLNTGIFLFSKSKKGKIMKYLLTLALSSSLIVSTSFADSQFKTKEPEKERQKLLKLLKQKYPNIEVNQFIYGALAYEPDAKSQYDAIMEFPPFLNFLEQGKSLWETPFKNGKNYASCFKNNAKNILGNYPYFDEKLKKVVTFEMALNICREKNNEPAYDYENKDFLNLIAYSRTLSDGSKVNIQVKSKEALKAFNKGKEYFYTRRGQMNFACYHCHVNYFGEKIRSELLSPVIGQTTHWPVFRGGDQLFTLQIRYQNCNKQTRAEPAKLGSEDYNNLEYFHSYMSNGLELKSSVFRK